MALVLISTVCSISAFAAPPDNYIYENDIKSRVQLVNITKPEGKGVEITYNKSFSICGVTQKENIRVRLQRYNKEKDKYEDIAIGRNGKINYYDIGESGFFSKEIELVEGGNNIRFIAYRISNPKNYQVNYFDITFSRKSDMLDEIKDKIFDPLKSMINKKDKDKD